MTEISSLCLQGDHVGHTLTHLLTSRALAEVLVRSATRAHSLIVHARFQLGLQISKANPERRQKLLTQSLADLKSSVEALEPVLQAFALASVELDKLTIGQQTPEAAAWLALVLEDHRFRFAQIRDLLKVWQNP